jgi:hypothetical protein
MQESFLKRIFYVFFEARYEDEYGMRTYGLNTDDQLKTILILYYDFIRSQHIEGFDNFLKQLKDQPTLDQQKKINEILMGLNYDRKKTLFTKKKFDLELFGYIEDVLKDVQVYLQDRRELEQYESSNEISTSKSHEFEWCGNKNDLVELVYGLIEAGVLRYTDKKMVVKGFASFLGVNIEDPNTQLQAIKKRKGSNNSQTELLDKMKQKLSLYLNKLT